MCWSRARIWGSSPSTFETFSAGERFFTLLNHEPVHVANMDAWNSTDARWRRLFHGKLAEAVERFTGRESTEVQILYPKDWADAAEPDHVNARFADLHAEMAARSIV